jgi:acyl-CoA thioester hydrolase
MKIRVYYHDTDCGGVVYYANYLKYLEQARTEALEEKGIFMKDLIAGGNFFVVSRQEVDYKSPAVYDDVLDVATKIAEITGVRIIFENEIKNQTGRLIIKARTTLVFVDKNFKPSPITDDIKKRIS